MGTKLQMETYFATCKTNVYFEARSLTMRTFSLYTKRENWNLSKQFSLDQNETEKWNLPIEIRNSHITCAIIVIIIKKHKSFVL